MGEHTPADERSVFDAVQKVIGNLLEFDADSRLRIYRTAGAFFGFENPYSTGEHAAPSETSGKQPREPQFSQREELTPKDFLFRKAPETDIDRAVCLAYYLTHHRDTHHFTTANISKLNTEAARSKFSNPSNTIANAIRSGLLAAAARGTRQLTAYGEQYVEALPDRTAAKAFLQNRRSKRVRKSVGNDATRPAAAEAH